MPFLLGIRCQPRQGRLPLLSQIALLAICGLPIPAANRGGAVADSAGISNLLRWQLPFLLRFGFWSLAGYGR